MHKVLSRYMRRIQNFAPDPATHVFRGQSDAKWPLHSGAARRLVAHGIDDNGPYFVDEYLDYHRHLLDRARRVTPYGHKDQSVTALHLLANLQHFGAATGLLDFTYSPLLALWFASEDSGHDGKVFLLRNQLPNTAHLTPELEQQDIGNVLSRTQDATGHGYLLWEPLVDGDAALRILGQRSVFVIGRPDIDAKQVESIVIDAADKDLIRAELEHLDVSERTIYRDLVGFCQLEGPNARYVPPTTPAAYLRRANRAYILGEYLEAVEAYTTSMRPWDAIRKR